MATKTSSKKPTTPRRKSTRTNTTGKKAASKTAVYEQKTDASQVSGFSESAPTSAQLVEAQAVTTKALAGEPDAAEAERPKSQGRTKQSQGKGWNNILNAAKRFVAERPDDHLSSLLVNLRELNISRTDPGRFYTKRELVRELGQSIMAADGHSVGDGFYYPDVRAGRYDLGHISPIRYLSKLIRPDTTAVMEVGSGWSSNLFQLYIAHGTTRSRKIIYYGGEYTNEGMICAKYIARREPDLKYRAFRFDYRDPDVTFLERQKGHILLFTSHSIEQVDEISPNLFEQLAEIPNDVTVVHFEPVGWQSDANLLAKRQKGDDAFFEAIGERAAAGDISSVQENSAWWSWRLAYNKNLVPILDDLEGQGLIATRRREYNFNGLANVLNPSSLFHYDFIR